MTIIGAVRIGDETYIGGDSRITYGDTFIDAPGNEKVFRVSGLVIGYCGDVRLGNILKHNFDPPPYIKSKTVLDEQVYIVSVFTEHLRECLKDYGYAKGRDGRERGGDLIVCINDKIFDVSENYSVTQHKGHVFIGSGDTYASGAFSSYMSIVEFPDAREGLKVALDASCRLCLSCGGKIKLIKV